MGFEQGESSIKDLRPGEHGYTLPWALSADEMGRIWARGDYPVTEHSAGTSSMEITRTDTGIKIEAGSRFVQHSDKPLDAWDPLPVEGNLPVQEQIKDMKPGEIKYAVPWAISKDLDGKTWIRGDYSAEDKKEGTASVEIKRTGDGIDVVSGLEGNREGKVCSGKPLDAWDPLPVLHID